MVRKATRAAALKVSEKTRESPRRGRRRKSTSSSENTDEEILAKLKQPQQEEKDSSAAEESDTESKKPLKKRHSRSRHKKSSKTNDTTSNTSSTTAITTDTMESKASQEGNDEEESKGKSLNVNESQQSDNGETVQQVTDESPVIDQPSKVPVDDDDDDGGGNGVDVDEPSNNGQSSTIDINVSQTLVAEMTCDNNQSSEVTTEETTEIVITEKKEESVEENSTDLTQSLDEPAVVTTVKKIKLNRLSRDDNNESKHQSDNGKRKITLKRPEKTIEAETANADSGNIQWSSSYEATDNKKEEEKRSRKKITLKRSTVDESDSKKEAVLLGRSVSVPGADVAAPEEQPKSSLDNIVIEKKRRRHSVMEKPIQNEEKPAKPKKPSKVIKLIRQFAETSQEPLPPGEEQPPKRHKWNQTNLTCSFISILDYDRIKEICPTVDFVAENEVELDSEPPKSPEKIKQRKTFLELEEEEMENIEAELNAELEQGETKENIIAMNRKISIVDDTAGKLRPPASPARNPVSAVLFITNLVRPFTAKQLKDLLERTGKIKEDGFWTDRIKSKCYVCYKTAEEAEATRNALHGVHWPIGNGKKLIIDYATLEDMKNAKNPPLPVVTTVPKTIKGKSPEKENKKPDSHETSKVKEKEEEHHRHRKRRSLSRSSRERRERKHSRRSYTPVDPRGKKRRPVEEPVPVKAMDDLFRKTVATPSIYWQPLSPEEIALKQQQRQARLEMNKRRLAEFRTTSSRGVAPRERSGRDRNFRRR